MESADLRSKHKRVARVRDRPVNLSCQSLQPVCPLRVPPGGGTAAGCNIDLVARDTQRVVPVCAIVVRPGDRQCYSNQHPYPPRICPPMLL